MLTVGTTLEAVDEVVDEFSLEGVPVDEPPTEEEPPVEDELPTEDSSASEEVPVDEPEAFDVPLELEPTTEEASAPVVSLQATREIASTVHRRIEIILFILVTSKNFIYHRKHYARLRNRPFGKETCDTTMPANIIRHPIQPTGDIISNSGSRTMMQ